MPGVSAAPSCKGKTTSCSPQALALPMHRLQVLCRSAPGMSPGSFQRSSLLPLEPSLQQSSRASSLICSSSTAAPSAQCPYEGISLPMARLET